MDVELYNEYFDAMMEAYANGNIEAAEYYQSLLDELGGLN